MEFMGNDGHAPSLPILCGFASVSHTVACARTNKSECLSKNEVFRQSEAHRISFFCITCPACYSNSLLHCPNPPALSRSHRLSWRVNRSHVVWSAHTVRTAILHRCVKRIPGCVATRDSFQSVKKLSKRPVCGIIKETGVLLWNNGKKIREAKF